MRTLVTQQPESLSRAVARNRLHAFARCWLSACARALPAVLAVSTAIFAAQFAFGLTLAAQTSTTAATNPASQTSTPPSTPAHRRKKASTANTAPQTVAQPTSAPASVAPSAPVPVPCPDASSTPALSVAPALPPAPILSPAAPCIPNWPANKKPAEASIIWDSHGLFIQASNSSLDQILNDISLKTGAKVEGMGADERVFGTYGPGPARDVLAELLDGTGYNVLLVGDLGQGTPRRIVLSGRPIGAAQSPGQNSPAQNEGEQDEPVTWPEPPPPGPSSQPGPPPVPARSPEPTRPRRLQDVQPVQPPPQQDSPQNPQ